MGTPRRATTNNGSGDSKGHAEGPFWRWVSSWARAIRRPSDYGFDDNGFILPPLDHRVHVVEARTPHPDMLFDAPAFGLVCGKSARVAAHHRRAVRNRR